MTNLVKRRLSVCLAVLVTVIYMVLFMVSESQVGIVLLLVLAAAALYFLNKNNVISSLKNNFSEDEKFSNAMVAGGVIILGLVFISDHFTLLMFTTVLVYAAVCLGLNIQFGYTGIVNFAGAAFFGAGGYAAAMLTQHTHMPHILILFIAGIIAALMGFLLVLPMLRTRGHYAAVVTIAFSLLFRTLVEVNPLLGGAQGTSVSSFQIFGLDFNQGYQIGSLEISFYINYFLAALLLVSLVFIIVRRIERSWIGLTFDSIRVDETASACFGINVPKFKVMAFSIGNFFLGFLGAFYAMLLGFIAPNNFTFGDSLIMVSIILLGGIGSIWGIVLAAVIVIILPEKFQLIQEYRFLIFSLCVMLVLLYRPNGLIKRGMRDYFPSFGGGK